MRTNKNNMQKLETNCKSNEQVRNMNRKNFETVLEQYMGRLAGLEQADDSDSGLQMACCGLL